MILNAAEKSPKAGRQATTENPCVIDTRGKFATRVVENHQFIRVFASANGVKNTGGIYVQ
jgi:hypothetical protein